MSTKDTNPANFANLPKDKVREIASKGGHASHGSHPENHKSSQDQHSENNHKSKTHHTTTKDPEHEKEEKPKHAGQGGTKETNPGNFANWDKDALRAVAAKGGHNSHKNDHKKEETKEEENCGNHLRSMDHKKEDSDSD